ncbi:MAG: 5-methyltetrahydropteroyltriglutamate--homocysteine S-methyltransferase [Saccharofermentans sp.]|nr:5-methyltetrahydropteroyltriglutamate--homocysteine S-methyltransferase [Saccharofermentans sp.]
MATSVIGYPRIGNLRELKFASEKYFRNEINAEQLTKVAKDIRKYNLDVQTKGGIDYIPSGDFSYYDALLDTAVLLGVVPARYKELGLSELDTYFAMARGYQGPKGDVKAFAMKKWFNTNYHYLVPEVEDDVKIELNAKVPYELYSEALSLGVKTVPVTVGPFTFLKLARFVGSKTKEDIAGSVISAYKDLIAGFAKLGAEWVRFDEPYLVRDLNSEDIAFFEQLYKEILGAKCGVKILLQTYFGDIRDCYKNVISLGFDGIGLDLIEGKKTLSLIKENGFPEDKILFAGVVNGKNIWRNNYGKTLAIVSELRECVSDIVIGTSCSLLHVPCTTRSETKLSSDILKHFAFAEEKIDELSELDKILGSSDPESLPEYKANAELHAITRSGADDAVQKKVAALSDKDFTRLPGFAAREKIQKERFNFPLFPTTTIGSFPQTQEVRAKRSAFRKGEIDTAEYESFIEGKIEECIRLQEEIGLDVLVHGEFERNDMVEYFGECLEGYIFTERAWVLSYGTRCVKPPVVWGDIRRAKPMTVRWSKFTQSLTGKPVKGMLTGPVTILNWSFPREDISLKQSALQIALAIREEVLDLEANGISIIQVDEAALREKLPLRRADWHEDYLDWAIPAFRLVHSGLKPETQLHTHMCYSEFSDIIKEIDDMDADVITFEASRSDLTILDTLKENNFRTEVGPGVYDIHSPRIPSKEEIKDAISKMTKRVPIDKLWVNPDCGLKTRENEETVPSLRNLVAAAVEARNENN